MVMDKRKNPTRTVAFWRFVDARDGGPLAQIDWPAFLAKVDKRRRNKRTTRYDIEGTDVTGSIYTRDVDHLVLTKDRDDMPRQQNQATGEVAVMVTTDEGWSVIESAFISFADFGNVFGLLRSQITAPSPQAVAKWVNKTNLITEPLGVEPVIDPQRWQHLHAAGGVTRLEFAASSFVLDRPVTGPLDRFLGPARNGSFKIDMAISTKATRTPEYQRQRRDLFEAAEALATQIGVEYLDKAKVKVFDEDNKGIKADTINLLKHRFSIKRTIELISGRAASVSEPSAFDAILDAFEQFDEDLRAAVREDPLD